MSVTTTPNNDMNFRSVNEVVTTQQVPLGGYSDASAIELVPSNSEIFQSPYKGFNMETYTVDHILNREFEVLDYEWNSDVTHGTRTLRFPQELFSKEPIQSLVKCFGLFRAGIRLNIRVLSTPTQYGSLMFNWNPMPKSDPLIYLQGDSAESASGYPHIIVSAASSTVNVLDIPFVSDKRAVDLFNYEEDEMARVMLRIVNPLRDVSGDVTKARVIVTAQFIDAELMMPTTRHSITPYVATTSVSPLVVETVEHPEPTIIQGQLQMAEPQSNPREEAIAKSDGPVTMALDATKELAAHASHLPFVGDFAQLYKEGAGIITDGIRSKGLCKPNTLNYNSVVRVDPHFDHNVGDGICTANSFSVLRENAISTHPLGGVSVDEMSFDYYKQLPQLIDRETLTAGRGIGYRLEPNNMCHVDNLSRLFNFTTGSYKYAFYIMASKFTTARLVFYLCAEEDAYDEKWTDCYHEIVEVQGDTIYTVTVPYIASSFGSNRNSFFLLKCLVLSLVDGNEEPSPIYMNVFKAGASDMEFYGPIDPQFNRKVATPTSLMAEPQSNPRELFTKEFKPIHPSMKGYSQTGLVMGEKITHFKQLMTRLMPYRRFNYNEACLALSAPEILPDEDKVQYYSCLFGLEALCVPFRFSRGSVRHKYVLRGETTRNRAATFSIAGDGSFNQNPSVVFSSSMNPCLDAIIPYYSTQLIESNGVTPKTRRYVTPSAPTFCFKAAGDDFSTHFVRGMPLFTPEIFPDRGIPGVINAFNSNS